MASLIWICLLKGTRKNCESCPVIIFCTVWNNEVVKLTLYGVTRRSGIQDSFLFHQWAKVVHMKFSFQCRILIKMTKLFWYVRIVFCPTKLVLFDFYVLNHKQHCCLICGVTFYKKTKCKPRHSKISKFSRGNPLDTRAFDGANIHTLVLKCNFLRKTLALDLYHCWKVVLFIVKLTADYLTHFRPKRLERGIAQQILSYSLNKLRCRWSDRVFCSPAFLENSIR